MGATSWMFLVIGSFAALGAAMALGTLAALLRFRRTGTFPDGSGALDDGPVPRRRIVELWMRVVVGAVLAVAGVAALVARGLL